MESLAATLISEEIIEFISDDYVQMIDIYSYTVDSWSQELLCCITHLIGLICSCYCWGSGIKRNIKKLVLGEETLCIHVLDLIRIVSHQPFYERITSKWINNETILIDYILSSIMGLLQTENLSSFIRSETTFPMTLLTLAHSAKFDRIHICAYGLLAELLSDEQLKELKITENLSDFFFTILENAWKNPSQRYRRIPIALLLRGFLNLTKNDIVQTSTANSNKTSLLIEMSDNYPIVFDILWSLSFHSSIREQLRSNQPFMAKLAHIEKESNDEKMRQIVLGILWNVNWHQDDTISLDKSHSTTFDIMISYSHKDKQICKQLYDELIRSGYRVWIDFDQMHGNVMDAMAQAIEQSRMVIICMSEQYRRSNYCRAEAQYAFQRQLRMVPVLLQKHYKPDGWLSFLIGQLLYIDFTKHEFPRAMEMLIKELRASQILDTQKTPITFITSSSIVSSTKEYIFPENVRDWTQAHVREWLRENSLSQMTNLLSDIDGPCLIRLREYVTKCEPQLILALLQHDSFRRTNQSLSLIEWSHFHSLLEQERFQSSTNVESTKERKVSRTKKWTFRYCRLM
ncbi:unnamed protein product [Didymodactylos carnosus]|uniref:TIR domain-containing protein n=1 Tax=Didymodactylos carnosus TaxID=1234261 RepID=A0A815CN24_9BILA|nr:unnamed protein product [Didymodactylos carnosus]CAF4086163.1 unnamed protein product [Didymodactylos carnosus]